MSTSIWVGTEEWGGLSPSQPRKDLLSPPAWRLEAVTATARPYALTLHRESGVMCHLLDRSDLGCDAWTLDPVTMETTQITVDRGPNPFWEDSTPRISPDGSRMAYTADGWVAVVDLPGGPARRLVHASSPHWLNDQTLAVLIDQERSRLPADPTDRTAHVTRMATVDLDDPWPRPITPAGWGDVSDIVPTPDGSRVAVVSHPSHDRNRSDIRVLDLSATTATIVSSVDGMHSVDPSWSPDGSRLVYACESPGWYELFVWDGAGDSWQLTDDGADFVSPRWSPTGKRIVACRRRKGRSDLVTIAVPDGALDLIAPGGSWSDAEWLSETDLVALYEDHRTPPRIERIPLDGRRSALFEPAPAPVRRAPHVTPIEVTFPSSDGLEIHGFLFRPRGGDDRAVPAVVYPHGGPTSFYGDEWDGHAQFFVDKGYAWLAINYRGSTTYGRTFERANHGVWGVDDTADCLAAHRYLADLEWVDAARIGIFGASYGSYLALAALVAEPDRYRCGVAKYGDSDILTSWAQGDRGGSEDMERMMGHPADNRGAYLEGSPIHNVAAIARPILVAHGERDDRVHPAQSRELVTELKRLGKTYEYVTYPTEGHGLLRSQPQLHFYRRLERFLDWYLM